jgi:hypothetical protein
MDGNGNAEDALRQIDAGRYALPYAMDKREIIKVGVVFDSKKRNISEWRFKNENDQ